MRVDQEQVFVLHRRDYRETSLLLELFSRHHGRIGAVMKGAKRKSGADAAALAPFQGLTASWSGRGELVTLTQVDPVGRLRSLSGERLMCGFYMNELLLRLLHRDDPHEDIYDRYRESLDALETGAVQLVLRRFEKALLDGLGYGLVLDHDVTDGSPLDPARLYEYIPDRGPRPMGHEGAGHVQVHGRSLLALAGTDELDQAALTEIKVLMRTLIDHHLDGRPLHSRNLMQAMHRSLDNRKTKQEPRP